MAMSDRIAVMEGGEIRQCGTPDDIYNRPDYLSVARFVGMTAINEIPVDIRTGAVMVKDQPLRLTLPGIADGAYTLSVRPEALEPVSDGGGDFSLPVAQVEFAGNEVGIRFDGSAIGAGWIRSQLRPEAFTRLASGTSVGEQLTLRIIPEAALLFDRDGRRITTLSKADQREERRHELAL